MRTTKLLLVALGVTTTIAVVVSCGFFWANQARMVAVIEAVRARNAERAALEDNKLLEAYRAKAEQNEQLKAHARAAAASEGAATDEFVAPTLGVELKNDDDLATLHASEEKTVVDIQCPTGTGAVILIRPGDAWPQPFVLRLQIKGLENLLIMTGRGSLHAAVPGAEEQPTKVWRNENSKELLDAKSPWHLPIVTPTADRPYFEITLPQQLLDDAGETMRIQWLDFNH